MNERICIKCRTVMEVIKNGFYHLGPDGGIRSSDLWYCHICNRFQIHGIAQEQHPLWPLFGLVKGERVEDPNNSPWLAYLAPEIHFLPAFHEHIRKWYPELILIEELWKK